MRWVQVAVCLPGMNMTPNTIERTVTRLLVRCALCSPFAAVPNLALAQSVQGAEPEARSMPSYYGKCHISEVARHTRCRTSHRWMAAADFVMPVIDLSALTQIGTLSV